FTQPALWRVYSYSKGIPRLVNAVCDKALLAGFVQQRERIGFGAIGRAVRELEGHIDALKRAKQAQQCAPPPIQGGPQLRPVDPTPQVRHGLPFLLATIVGGVI